MGGGLDGVGSVVLLLRSGYFRCAPMHALATGSAQRTGVSVRRDTMVMIAPSGDGESRGDRGGGGLNHDHVHVAMYACKFMQVIFSRCHYHYDCYYSSSSLVCVCGGGCYNSDGCGSGCDSYYGCALFSVVPALPCPPLPVPRPPLAVRVAVW